NIHKKAAIKKELDIDEKFNLLFVGRLHESKHVLDVIKAIEKLKMELNFLIVGDGLLRKDLETYILSRDLRACKMLGFKNQKEIMNYYLVADAFVLPSNYLETWGLVVNEAMNFNLPLILSDKVGCAPDLCNPTNGFIFELGDIKTLASKIEYLANNPNIAKEMGVESGELIKAYSYKTIIDNLIQTL
ncbi:MAG: glycosyltransferase family 4 protein, partial [Aquaticitalea sp.]